MIIHILTYYSLFIWLAYLSLQAITWRGEGGKGSTAEESQTIAWAAESFLSHKVPLQMIHLLEVLLK